MDQFKTKFRLIFVPYLIVVFSAICIYTFLNWLILVKLQLFKFDEDIFNIIIPCAIPWLPIFIWLRPRLRLLNLKKEGRRDPIGGLIYLQGISILVPLIIAQFYMVSATGKLTRLTYMSEVKRFPPTKYYTVKHFYVNKRLLHAKFVFTVTGKGNTNFNMDIYGCVPVFDHIYPDTNMITYMRNRMHPKGLIIINGNLSTMGILKKLPADSIKRMRFLNPSIVMPKYGDTGKFGALAVVTFGYKMKSDRHQLKYRL